MEINRVLLSNTYVVKCRNVVLLIYLYVQSERWPAGALGAGGRHAPAAGVPDTAGEGGGGDIRPLSEMNRLGQLGVRAERGRCC